MTIVKCGKCGLILDEPSDSQPEKRKHCPSCSSTNRAFEVSFHSKVDVSASVGMKARHSGQKSHLLNNFRVLNCGANLRSLFTKKEP